MKKPTHLLLAALAAIMLAQSAAATPFRLILTHLEPPLVPNSVMDLALEKGYLAAEGVEVEFVRVSETPSALQALVAGEGEMANVGNASMSVGPESTSACTSPG